MTSSPCTASRFLKVPRRRTRSPPSDCTASTFSTSSAQEQSSNPSVPPTSRSTRTSAPMKKADEENRLGKFVGDIHMGQAVLGDFLGMDRGFVGNHRDSAPDNEANERAAAQQPRFRVFRQCKPDKNENNEINRSAPHPEAANQPVPLVSVAEGGDQPNLLSQNPRRDHLKQNPQENEGHHPFGPPRKRSSWPGHSRPPRCDCKGAVTGHRLPRDVPAALRP